MYSNIFASKLFHSSVKRLSHTAISRLKIGFESSTYSNISYDKSIIERSIKSGCSLIITRSNKRAFEIYELLQDLAVFLLIKVHSNMIIIL